MTRFTASSLDLSALDPSSLFTPLTFEGIRAARVADLKARLTAAGWAYDVDALESDPAIYLQETGAYRELLTSQTIRDAQLSVTLAFARGPFLDQLGINQQTARATVTPAVLDANGNVVTPAVMESDTRYRARIQLAPEAYSATGTAGGYIYYAMGASPLVADCGVAVLNRGTPDVMVELTIMSSDNDGVPTPDVVAAVRNAVLADNVKLLTDTISIRAAQPVAYSVAGTLNILPGPDPALIQANALAALNAMAAKYRRLAGGVPLSAIVAALSVAGVDSVAVQSPAASIATQRFQFGAFAGANLTVATIFSPDD
jgi:phage-related baseplate assembly protein